MTATNTRLPQNPRTLGIALSTRGFGYALLESDHTLADWGVKRPQKDKSAKSAELIVKFMAQYKPELLILQNLETESSRRSSRARRLNRQLASFASRAGIAVKRFSRELVNKAFFPDGTGTKYKVAQALAAQFSSELSAMLPPPRKAWMTEDYRIDVFDAVALALMSRIGEKTKRA